MENTTLNPNLNELLRNYNKLRNLQKTIVSFCKLVKAKDSDGIKISITKIFDNQDERLFYIFEEEKKIQNEMHFIDLALMTNFNDNPSLSKVKKILKRRGGRFWQEVKDSLKRKIKDKKEGEEIEKNLEEMGMDVCPYCGLRACICSAEDFRTDKTDKKNILIVTV